MDQRITDGGSLRRVHSIHIEGRELMSISGVKDVESFNEQQVQLLTEMGGLCVEGDNLHITHLSLSDGNIIIEGELIGLEYSDIQEPRGSVFSRLFR